MNLRAARWADLRQSFIRRVHSLPNDASLQNTTHRFNIKHQSTQSTASNATQTAPTATRFDRFIARTPTKFLRTRLSVLKNAPLTHITAFLLLHEVTAIIPLFGLAAAFHYYEWLPPYFAEGAWVLKGVNMFGNYFRKKGWIDSDDAEDVKALVKEGHAEEVEQPKKKRILDAGKWWNRGEGGARLVVEFATAYAIVKALMPVRIMISVWGAPWFARWTIIPVQNSVKRWWSSRRRS